jgi:hypothetical protein
LVSDYSIKNTSRRSHQLNDDRQLYLFFSVYVVENNLEECKMNRQKWTCIGALLLTVGLIGSATPSFGQDGDLIDDFEGQDVGTRWWFWEESATLDCGPGSPGYESGQALHLVFDIPSEVYPGCGTGITDPARWADSGGMQFVWRSDQPGLAITFVLNISDPTQTNRDAGGYTPFYVIAQTPGETWTEVTISWDAFAKSEWVGASGMDVLDPSRAGELLILPSPAQAGIVWIDDLRLVMRTESPPGTSSGTGPSPMVGEYDKFALWTSGTQLRGANIWQRVVFPAWDGREFLGSDYVGPPYIQADFDRLAALGANYVNISGPGLYSETPPYVLDEKVQAHWDNLLAMVEQADLFAVITFRTGPGRSDFTFYDAGIKAGEWGDPSLVVENVWTDRAAQDAWVEMWHTTAARYRDNPIVVGYDLMCEPNAPGRLLEIWDGGEFYASYAGTLYDWNQFYPRIVEVIREVDSDTPILISPIGWGAVRWLPYLEPVDDPRIVYTVHQYEPQDQYTHQEPSGANTYPGRFDLNWDGEPDDFDRAWLDGFLSIIDDFKARHGMPVAVNEYGVVRWVPNAADFMRDEMALFERRRMNHAFWVFNPAWAPFQQSVDEFNFQHGPDPNNHQDVASSALLDVILANWSQNTIRPSTVR